MSERRRIQIRGIRDLAGARAALNSVSTLVQPTPTTLLAAGVQAGLTRRLSITVADMLKQAWARPWPVFVWISASEWGAPGGPQTAALISGIAMETVVADCAWRFLSTAAALVEIDVTLPAAGTRYLHATAGGEAESMKAAWV